MLPVLYGRTLALWQAMNCGVSAKKGKKREENTIKIKLGMNDGRADDDSKRNKRTESVC